MHAEEVPVRGMLPPKGPRCRRSAVLVVVAIVIASCSVSGCARDARHEALDKAKARVQAQPRSPDAHYALARAYYGVGSKGRALETVRRAVELEPKRGDLRYATALLLAEFGRPSEAAAEAEAALPHITKPTHEAEIHAFLGNRYWDLGEQERARQSYTAAVRCDPSSPAGFLGLGALAGEAGDNKAARMYFSKALAVAKEPRDRAKAHCGLGKTLEIAGDFAGARRQYRAALAASPGYAGAREGLERLEFMGR